MEHVVWLYWQYLAKDCKICSPGNPKEACTNWAALTEYRFIHNSAKNRSPLWNINSQTLVQILAFLLKHGLHFRGLHAKTCISAVCDPGRVTLPASTEERIMVKLPTTTGDCHKWPPGRLFASAILNFCRERKSSFFGRNVTNDTLIYRSGPQFCSGWSKSSSLWENVWESSKNYGLTRMQLLKIKTGTTNIKREGLKKLFASKKKGIDFSLSLKKKSLHFHFH